MRSKHLILLAVVVVLAVVGALVRSATARPLESVKYATSFGTFGRDSYVYVALDRGYFRDAGLDVTIVPGAGTENARLLAAGTIDYMANDVSGSSYQKAIQGFPIRAVAVTSQQNQSAIAVLADSPITTPKQLEGHTIADTPSSIGQILFPFYAKKAGIDASTVKYIPSTPPAIPSLLATGKVDAAGQFTVGLPLLQKAAGGKKIRMFKYSQYLPGLLGNAVWTTDDRIRTNPDQVKRFVGAILKGLNYAVQNPGSAGAIMNKALPLADPVVAAQEMRILRSYVQTKCTRKYGIGYIDIGKMKSTASLIRNAFKTDKIRFNDIYATGFVKAATCKA